MFPGESAIDTGVELKGHEHVVLAYNHMLIHLRLGVNTYVCISDRAHTRPAAQYFAVNNITFISSADGILKSH